MRSVVVFESKYGNTAAIADAVARGLRTVGPVEQVTSGEARPDVLDGVQLLVVGSPTHAWGVPSARTWDAPARGRVSEPTPGATPSPRLRDWLASAPLGAGRSCAVFATRIDKVRLIAGSATGGLARRVRRRGWNVVDRADFLVSGTDGPLAAGELQRAEAWGAELGRAVSGA